MRIPVGLILFLAFSAALLILKLLGVADNNSILGLGKFPSAILLIFFTLVLTVIIAVVGMALFQ